MGVGDDQLHPAQAAGAQAAQEAGPEGGVLGVADGQAEHLTDAVGGDAGGDDDRFGHDVGAVVGLHVGGVQEQVGELDVIEAAFTELADGDVELGTDPRHVTLRHPGIDPQRGDEVVDLAGRHAVHERFHDHRPQRPVDPPTRFQQRRVEAAVTQLGDGQLDVAGLRRQQPGPGPVALGRAGLAAFVAGGADVLVRPPARSTPAAPAASPHA